VRQIFSVERDFTTEEIWMPSLDTNVKGLFFWRRLSAVAAAFEWRDCEFCGYAAAFGLAGIHCALDF